VSQHMGPHNVAKRLRLLEVAAPGAAKSKNHVFLLANGRPYKRCKADELTSRAVAQHVDLGKTMAKVSAPRTLQEWASQYHTLEPACTHVPGISDRAKYHRPWFLRAWLKMIMERHGVQELSLGAATPHDFANLWPDVGAHVLRLLGSHDTVYQAFSHLRYDGPPELFTMYCCLFSAPEVARAVTAKPVSWLGDNRAALRKLRAEYERVHAQSPCPTVLLSECVRHL